MARDNEDMRFAERRTIHLTFRVTPTQKQKLDRLCAEHQIGQSEFCLRALDYFVDYLSRQRASGRKK